MMQQLWKKFSQKIKRKITIWSNNSPLRCIPKKITSRDSNRYSYANTHGGIIHDRQKVEIIQASINRWMDKQNKAYTYNGISSAIKWNTDPCYNIMLGEINRTWKINTEWLHLNEISIIGNSERQKVEERLRETGGGGNGELLPNGYKMSVCSDEKVLEIDSGNGCTTSWMLLILLIGTL